MGTWGLKNFESDEASDFWRDVLEGSRDLIKNAIEKVVRTSSSEYLEAPDCLNALAAIEFIMAAKGKPSVDFPEEAKEWLAENDVLNFKGGLFSGKIDMFALSLKAIERICNNSELKDLWEESEEYENWIKVQTDLKNRISCAFSKN